MEITEDIRLALLEALQQQKTMTRESLKGLGGSKHQGAPRTGSGIKKGVTLMDENRNVIGKWDHIDDLCEERDIQLHKVRTACQTGRSMKSRDNTITYYAEYYILDKKDVAG
jgi:hypothetical protein